MQATSTPSVNYHCDVCEPGCSVCGKPCPAWYMCHSCDVKRLREQFQTSGSKEIDAIIQKSWETASHYSHYWEWIEPTQFEDIKHLADGGFSSVYTATWIDGPRDVDARSRRSKEVVVLKVPNMAGNSNNDNITVEFLNEVGVNNRIILGSIVYIYTVFTMNVCVNSKVLMFVSFFESNSLQIYSAS